MLLMTQVRFPVRAMNELWQQVWYELILQPTAFLAQFGFSLRVQGRRNVPRAGGLLVVANHQSYLDPPLVGVAAARHLSYLAKKSLFNHQPLGWLIGSVGAVPINREAAGTEGIKTALALLKQGRAVLIFPEGGRSENGLMQPLMPGVVVLIRRSGVPILPVGVAGTYQAWPPHRTLPRLSPIAWPATGAGVAVVIGKPIHAKTLAGLPPKQMLSKLHVELLGLHQAAERIRRK